jgi:polyisoprenoid-binding protein YceI
MMSTDRGSKQKVCDNVATVKIPVEEFNISYKYCLIESIVLLYDITKRIQCDFVRLMRRSRS